MKSPLILNYFPQAVTRWRYLALSAGVVLIGIAGSTAQAQTVKKAAIFVENRAGAEYNDKVKVFEDMLSSRASSAGFRIINRETVVNSINNYSAGPKVERTTTVVESSVVAQGQRATAVEASAEAVRANRSASVSQEASAAGAVVASGNRIGVAAGRSGSVSAQRDASISEGAAVVRGQQQTAIAENASAVAMKSVTHIAYPGEVSQSKLDDALSNQSSATRLAQSMGADLVLVASIVTLGTETRDFQDASLGIKS